MRALRFSLQVASLLSCKVNNLRATLLKQQRVPLPTSAETAPPSNALTPQQLEVTATDITGACTLCCDGRLVAGLRADSPRNYLTAWAILGWWTCLMLHPRQPSGPKCATQSMINSKIESRILERGPEATLSKEPCVLSLP